MNTRNPKQQVEAGNPGALFNGSKNRSRFILALVIILLVSALPTLAQKNSGAILGTVRDRSGAPLAAATVTVINTSTSAKRSDKTSNLGQYNIPGLMPGIYDVTITSMNLGEFKIRAEVTAGGFVTIDAKLATSEQTLTEVAGQGGVTVNTHTQELSQFVSEKDISQLPSLTRNPYDFVELSGNISDGDRTASGGDQNTTSRGVGYSLNGQRESGTEILLDGVENMNSFDATYGVQTPLDAVQELRVITNNFDVQYGRASGGVVNVVTKSGTNNFHGSLWEFNRLSDYTANTFANVAFGAPKGVYTRNQFGFDVGGPVIKNKLFFLGSAEWLRVRSNAIEEAYVPTTQFRALMAPNVQAYFNQYGNNSFAFANTLTAAQAGISTVPGATPALGQVNFSAPADAGGGVPTNTYRVLGRIDFNMSSNTQMFFRYALENIDNFKGADFASPYSQYNVGDTEFNNSGAYSLTHEFSSNLISNTKIGFSRLNPQQTYLPSSLSVPELLVTNGAFQNGLPIQLPGLWARFTGQGGEPYGGPQNMLQPMEDVEWIKGKHNVHFGGMLDYLQINQAYGAYAQAVQELGNSVPQGLDAMTAGTLVLFQTAVNPQGKLPCQVQPNGSLIQTPSCTISLPAGQPGFGRSYRYWDWALHGGDSWRMTQRFTVNYGFRLEHYGVQHNDIGALDSNFYYGPGGGYYQQVASGEVELAKLSPAGGLWTPSWGTLAPRFGFAYDVFGDGKMTVRGGAGIGYERNFGNVTFNAMQNPPAYASIAVTPSTVSTSNLGPFGAATGTVPLPPVELRQVDPNIRTAQTQFASLQVEREVARHSIVSVGWSGAHGIHLYDITLSNPLGGAQAFLGEPFTQGAACAGTGYVDPATGAPACYTRPNLQYSSIDTGGSSGSSHYSALNVGFRTTDFRNSGLSLVANYTWSHETDDLSSTFSDSTGGASAGIGDLGYLNPLTPRLDWGSGDYDIRHRVVISPIWQMPWLSQGRGWERQAGGGWTLTGIFTARTGTPFSIFDTSNSLNAATGYGIPRYVPSAAINTFQVGTPVQVAPNDFTALTLPTAVETPFNSTLGISDFGPYPANMTSRNAFRGPGAWNLDVAVTKSFALTERFALEFRAEGFNVLNHHNLYVEQLALNAANFTGGPIAVPELKGGLGTANVGEANYDERRFGQFSLRLIF